MKSFKKITALMMALLLVAASLTACGKKDEKSKEKKQAKVIEINLTDEEYAFGIDKDQPELLEKANTFIKQIMDDGTFDEICNKYFGDGEPSAVKSASLDTSKDQLVVATNAAFEPFEYVKGDSYYGIDMEIANAFAEYLGVELVIQDMDFDAVCLSVGQHKCDIAMAGLTVKPDREEYVTFTDSYYYASQKLVVPSTNTEFDNCKDAAAIEEILKSKDSKVKVGFQNGTTGQFYCEGDADWGFEGFKMSTTGYRNGSLAIQDLLNGNIDYVIIDAAPADFITKKINSMQ